MILETGALSFLSEGTRVQGSLTFFSGATVHSVVEGDVFQQSVEALHIGTKGWVHGSVTALGPVFVEGRIEGDLKTRSRVQISASGLVSGSIEAPSIEVAPGAQVNGILKIRGKSSGASIDSMS